VLRADRAGGDTKTPRSRRALQLAQIAVEALRAWQADQTAEREAAGSRWQDTGRVFTTATGTPLGARQVRKMFQDVCERAGLGRDWAPRDLRHTFVSLLSDDGMAIEKIARLAGQASSHVTETVYRQELGPVLQDGATVMDRALWQRQQRSGWATLGSSETSGSITDNARELGPALLPATWRQPRRDRHRRRAVFDQ